MEDWLFLQTTNLPITPFLEKNAQTFLTLIQQQNPLEDPNTDWFLYTQLYDAFMEHLL